MNKNNSKKTRAPAPSFEQAMAELEALVLKLENGDLALDDALTSFEQGVGLVRLCQKQLADAELKIQKIIAEDDGITTQVFGVEK